MPIGLQPLDPEFATVRFALPVGPRQAGSSGTAAELVHRDRVLADSGVPDPNSSPAAIRELEDDDPGWPSTRGGEHDLPLGVHEPADFVDGHRDHVSMTPIADVKASPGRVDHHFARTAHAVARRRTDRPAVDHRVGYRTAGSHRHPKGEPNEDSPAPLDDHSQSLHDPVVASRRWNPLRWRCFEDGSAEARTNIGQGSCSDHDPAVHREGNRGFDPSASAVAFVHSPT